MTTHCGPRIDATILGAASLLALAMGGGTADSDPGAAPASVVSEEETPAALVGVWTSADGTVRLDLRPDGRYERGIVGRDRTSTGTYRSHGLGVALRDDSGLRTGVQLVDGVLEMAGHRLYRG